MKRYFWPALAGVVLLGVVLVVLRLSCGDKQGNPETDGPVRVEPDSVILRDRPTTARPLKRRLTTYRAKPTIAESEGRPDTAIARKYAAAVARADSLADSLARVTQRRAAGDTSAHPELVPSPPRILPPAQGHLERGKIMVWGTRSDGSVGRATARLGPFHPRVDFVMGMDEKSDSIPVIDVDRWFVALGRQGLRCLPRAVVVGGGGGALVAPVNQQGRRDRLEAALLGSGLVLVGCLLG